MWGRLYVRLSSSAAVLKHEEEEGTAGAGEVVQRINSP